MARTRRSAEAYSSVAPSLESVFQVNSASFSTHQSDFPHALFAPMHYTPGYAYPLIVWLHGHGGDERQLQRVMPSVSMQNYMAVALRGIEMPDEEKRGGRPTDGCKPRNTFSRRSSAFSTLSTWLAGSSTYRGNGYSSPDSTLAEPWRCGSP